MKKFNNNFQALNCIDTLLMADNNMFSIKIIKNDKFYELIKYIDIQYHFIRELVEQKKISINYIKIKNMLVDEFNNALRKPEFENY